MRKVVAVLCFSYLLRLAVFGVCIAVNDATISPMPIDGVLRALDSTSYSIERPGIDADGRYHIRVESDKAAQATLTLTDMNPFSLYINGSLYYDYTQDSLFRRTHLVKLPEELFKSGRVDLAIEIDGGLFWGKLAIGGTGMTERRANVISMINCFCMGIEAMILIYSISLYLQKRTEKYLLMLMLITVVALLKALNTSVYPIFSLSHRLYILLQYPIDSLAKVLCLVLCLRMMDIKPSPLFKFLQSPAFTVAAAVVVLVLQFVNLRFKGIVLSAFYALCTLAMAVGYSKRRSDVLLALPIAGNAIRYGMHYYFRAANNGLTLSGLPITMMHTTQFGDLAFIICCITAINHVFVSKYNEADRLNNKLADINRGLDEVISERTKELKQANELIRKQQAQQRSIMINNFHDLRNPIFLAQGCAEMLKGRSEDDEETLQVLRSQLEYLKYLSDDIFLAAKLEDGKLTFVFVDVDLADLCRSMESELCLQAESNGLEISVILPDESLWCSADAFRLKQVVENLLSNACRFSHPKGRVTLELRRVADEARLFVSDDGAGIDADELPFIFDRFYHSTHSKNSSGLGLYIAHEIVSAHSGRIEVESEKGHGSVFCVCLPVVDPQ